jgi:hypothetical protein
MYLAYILSDVREFLRFEVGLNLQPEFAFISSAAFTLQSASLYTSLHDRFFLLNALMLSDGNPSAAILDSIKSLSVPASALQFKGNVFVKYHELR